MRKTILLCLFFFWGCTPNQSIQSQEQRIPQGLRLYLSAKNASFSPFRIEQVQCALNNVPFFLREYVEAMPLEPFKINTTFPVLRKENILSCTAKLIAKAEAKPVHLRRYAFRFTRRYSFLVKGKNSASIAVLFLRNVEEKGRKQGGGGSIDSCHQTAQTKPMASAPCVTFMPCRHFASLYHRGLAILFTRLD